MNKLNIKIIFEELLLKYKVSNEFVIKELDLDLVSETKDLNEEIKRYRERFYRALE